MHQTEARHFEIRKELVQFTVLNGSYFSVFCNPLTVVMHTQKVINNFVWGSHVEIFALSLYLGILCLLLLTKEMKSSTGQNIKYLRGMTKNCSSHHPQTIP